MDKRVLRKDSIPLLPCVMIIGLGSNPIIILYIMGTILDNSYFLS